MSDPVDIQESTKQVTGNESEEFVGRWNNLISTSNWEKGRIINEWRNALIDAGANPGQYSDEEWSRIVGAVTPQHVGRLRRVYQRFFTSYPSYEGLYWSHFFAANEWDDAEMWLEGAVQSNWSVSQMRKQRWEALGGSPTEKPGEKDIVTSEVDEDFQASSTEAMVSSSVETVENLDRRQDPADIPEFQPFDEEQSGSVESLEAEDQAATDATTAPTVRPFEELPELPDDLADAFDSFKLAILRHKVADWEEIAREDVLIVLESLKLLATAPSE